MKKLVLGVLAAALFSLGFSAPSAHADPYTGTVPSAPAHKVVKTKKGKSAHVVLVTPGGVRPRGFAYVTCRSLRGDHDAHRKGAVRNGVVKMPRLRTKGAYRCYIKFNGKGVFKNTLAVVKVRVR